MAVDMVEVDALTGAFSRSTLMGRLQLEIDEAHGSDAGLSLLMLDLDYFKSINDAFGHSRGDAVLGQFASWLKSQIRSTDALFRYGGDEFVLLLPGTGVCEAAQLGERLLDYLRATPFPGNPPLHLSLSIGVAGLPGEAGDAGTLLELADRRAYEAKRNGRGRVVWGTAPAQASDALAQSFHHTSRLVERDTALQQLKGFFDGLPGAGRGLLVISGQEGVGVTRFLHEVVTAAQLRGYFTLLLPGSPSNGELALADICAQVVAARSMGLALIVDDLGQLDDKHVALLRDLLQTDTGMPVAVACGGAAREVEARLQAEGVHAEVITLQPLSKEGLAVWLRSLLQWEPPAEFAPWLHKETEGLPGRVQQALTHLAENDTLGKTGQGWALRPDYASLQLARELGWESNPPPGNLPAVPYSFIGRNREVGQLRRLLQSQRLVTITGPGGIGKTHLALHVAAEMLGRYDDGVFFVPLGAISDPALVAPTVADVLGVQGSGNQPPAAALKAYLREKKALLLLDNFEQVAEAAPFVAELLGGCPQLAVLVTSREPLHIRGEHTYPVSPLAVPNVEPGASAQAIAEYPAVALFVERAEAVNPGFALTDSNAEAVAAICARVDGLPLAIELIAARTRLMPVATILARIGQPYGHHALALLTGGPRDLPKRHQTLRDAIAWSYDLLAEEEQRLFRYLSVFAGGFTLAAVEAIFTGESEVEFSAPHIDLLASLLDKSLLRVSEGEARYAMLETIREYACESLARDDMGESVKGLHAAYFGELAESAEQKLMGANQKETVRLLSGEHDNLRAALAWSIEAGHRARAIQLAGGLWRFWYLQGHIAEGRSWLGSALALPTDEAEDDEPLMGGRALQGAGVLARSQCEYEEAARLLTQSLEMMRQTGHALRIATVLNSLGLVALDRGQYAEAEPYFMQSLELERESGDKQRLAISLNNLGGVSHYQGRYERAAEFYNESLALRRELGDNWGIANSLHNLGEAAHFRGNYGEAARLHRESLALRDELGDVRGMAPCFEGLAGAEAALGDCERAARLFGAVEALRETHAAPVSHADRAAYENMVQAARAGMSEVEFSRAWSEGRVLPLKRAVALALEEG